MMKEEDVPDVPIYAAILYAIKHLRWKERGIDNTQALCREASPERKASNRNDRSEERRVGKECPV